ncbi:Ribonuclease P/MRP protein subunit POP5 [Schizosaccharomyces pombe]|uniref:Ribonuclease P/MRP protein subunit POP5 n=1 Tax=Schizosaccharomyces pombe (strain 972 / ATCC 24843) TaxID=284812 RepID=POP5_SCHPO|nr:putative Rnase P/MRP subunit [Schizosaccharomyces pombe]Q9UU90.1 RecName: Full=Ribonuclease P/MRP protein subunit POP5 [Schizosaccharomyces pombe 972h-]CAB52882.1 RNase P and RNase MRP subunit (predicted) [Schizosaccharomyces pombe]|eukprot:NP_001342905.1 putative Rnase P/MRP subunit [Schizosaccharomyces pombe]
MVRFKSRYLLFEVLYPEAKEFFDYPTIPSDSSITTSSLSKIIRTMVAENFGDVGIGKVASSLTVKYFSPNTSTGILRVSRQHFRLAWAALVLIRELYGKPVIIRVVRVSGTIKKAELAAIERNKSEIHNISLMDEPIEV